MARIHVVVPDDLLREIDRRVGARGRSKFVDEAVRKELDRRKQVEALQELSGVIRAEDHPEWATSEKVAEWVREQRRPWEGDPVANMAKANALRMLGDLKVRMGDVAGATRDYDAALDLARRFHDRWTEMSVLMAHGSLQEKLGDLGTAERDYDLALAIAREILDHLGEASALQALGDVRSKTGNEETARRDHEAALAASRKALDDF